MSNNHSAFITDGLGFFFDGGLPPSLVCILVCVVRTAECETMALTFEAVILVGRICGADVRGSGLD